MQGYEIECERCDEKFMLCRPCYRRTKYCEPCRETARTEHLRKSRRKYAASLHARLLRVHRNARARKKAASNETDPGLTFTSPAAHDDARDADGAAKERDDELEQAGPPLSGSLSGWVFDVAARDARAEREDAEGAPAAAAEPKSGEGAPQGASAVGAGAGARCARCGRAVDTLVSDEALPRTLRGVRDGTATLARGPPAPPETRRADGAG